MPFVATVLLTMPALVTAPVVAFVVIAPPRFSSTAVIAPLPFPLPVPAPVAIGGGVEVGDGERDEDPHLGVGRWDVRHQRYCNDRQPDGQQHCDQ